jgi:hypothetical protein
MSKCNRNTTVILCKNNFVRDGYLLHGQLEKNDLILVVFLYLSLSSRFKRHHFNRNIGVSYRTRDLRSLVFLKTQLAIVLHNMIFRNVSKLSSHCQMDVFYLIEDKYYA